MIELSYIKSTIRLNFILELSENLNVFEYAKKNRHLPLAYGMCYSKQFRHGK